MREPSRPVVLPAIVSAYCSNCLDQPISKPTIAPFYRFTTHLLAGTMSFGWSIGDCFLLIKGLWKLTTLLRGEAVASFRRYESMYYQLAGVAETLYQFAKEISDQGQDMRFGKEIKNIRRLLKKFFSSIQELKPHLGHSRRRYSLLSAIEKVKWPIYSDKLSQLHQDLMSQMAIITLLNQFHTG